MNLFKKRIGTSSSAGPRMEPLWSPVVANGGNRRQIEESRKPHGKEGVDGSSPSEGSAKAAHNGAFCFGPTCKPAQPTGAAHRTGILMRRTVATYASVLRDQTTSRPDRPLGCRVAELRCVREPAKLLQRLVLDLANPLARDIERQTDLVERARGLAVEPEAELQYLALTAGEHVQDLLQRFLAHRHLRRLVWQLLVPVA